MQISAIFFQMATARSGYLLLAASALQICLTTSTEGNREGVDPKVDICMVPMPYF